MVSGSIVLFAAAFVAGVMNAMAGGGSFVTLPALMLAGLDPRAANITSTVALFPGQVATAVVGRGMVVAPANLPFAVLFALSLAGGVCGAWLLLVTPPALFARLVPFLVLFATCVFAWGSFLRKPDPATPRLGPAAAGAIQFAIAVYGGYYGGGIGFLMLAAWALAGIATRAGIATKNVLGAAMNAAAVLVFLFSPEVHWLPAAVVAVAAILGGLVGAWGLKRVNERLLRMVVVATGAVLTAGLFLRAG